ncbi:Porphobilinogen deaminase, dipyromethane cofactor binding domain [Gordonia westfalica]|uniref:hydroxymethylbilane synthase n=1 Tax=Gordonia westfalica TaxID=158898 RepID=A0A1H2K011_9ACTN|nr:Porphobilinogen deaminase, dipyromethane cofactor binding domain [Gordonia westfalica]
MTDSRTAPIRIGTRGSLLATTQSQTIADALTAAGHPAELVIIKTAGDASSAPVAEIGVGVFTTAIRVALRNDEVDVAVHSYKDLPTAPRTTSRSRPSRPGWTRETRWSAGTIWCSANCRRDRWSAPRRPAGRHSLRHWVSVWKSAPYEAT